MVINGPLGVDQLHKPIAQREQNSQRSVDGHWRRNDLPEGTGVTRHDDGRRVERRSNVGHGSGAATTRGWPLAGRDLACWGTSGVTWFRPARWSRRRKVRLTSRGPPHLTQGDPMVYRSRRSRAVIAAALPQRCSASRPRSSPGRPRPSTPTPPSPPARHGRHSDPCGQGPAPDPGAGPHRARRPRLRRGRAAHRGRRGSPPAARGWPTTCASPTSSSARRGTTGQRGVRRRDTRVAAAVGPRQLPHARRLQRRHAPARDHPARTSPRGSICRTRRSTAGPSRASRSAPTSGARGRPSGVPADGCAPRPRVALG